MSTHEAASSENYRKYIRSVVNIRVTTVLDETVVIDPAIVVATVVAGVVASAVPPTQQPILGATTGVVAAELHFTGEPGRSVKPEIAQFPSSKHTEY